VVDGARRAAADLLGAGPDEVAFGANMTTLAFHLARALGRRMPAGPAAGRALGPGDEVVVTELDHHGNVAPWTALAHERGVTVRTARMDPGTFGLDWDHLAALVGPRTRLVAVGAASNALGTITDVARAAGLARHAGALTFVDAVHWAPHAAIDVGRLAEAGVDFLACSPYKFHGPHAGLLWGRPELIAALDVPRVAPASDAVPDRLETGTRNFEGLAGTIAAVDFLASLGDPAPAPSATGLSAAGPSAAGDQPGAAPAGSRRARLARAYARLGAHERALARQLWDGLRAIPGVTVHGPPPDRPRTPTVSFTVPGGARSRWRATSPGAPCSRRTATSTRRRWCRASGFPTASCAPARRATPRPTRSTASSPPWPRRPKACRCRSLGAALPTAASGRRPASTHRRACRPNTPGRRSRPTLARVSPSACASSRARSARPPTR
jgi:cysteine desulfurase family protein (TIGR01976 family)